MKLSTQYQGERDPFEGDRTLWLRSLPDGARVTRATISLEPAGDLLFDETFIFDASNDSSGLSAEEWGITQNSGSSGGVRFVEIDFHVRRTLVAVQGSQSGIGNVPDTNIPGASLQVDMGGAFIGVADDGTFMAPDKQPWVVAFSPGNLVALPSLTVNKFRLSGTLQDPDTPNNSTLDIAKITIRSVPTNVSLRLHQMPPFWTHLGELTIPKTSPDFATILNTFLETASVENGFYRIPLVIHSDTIARLNITFLIEFVIEQPVLPPHLSEVNLAYNFSTLAKIDPSLMTVKLPRGAIPIPSGTRAAILGEFQPTRIAYGSVGATPHTIPVRITPDGSLAQPFLSDREIAVTGIDLSLANTQPGLAGLNVSIQADVDGKPFGEVLTSAEVLVEKPLPNQSSWGSATLPAPFRVLQDTRYWLVVQSQTGDAYWDTTPGATMETLLHSTFDRGLSWRPTTVPESPTANAAALFRLRNLPDRFTIPVQLQIGEEPNAVRRQLDEFAPLGRVEFEFDFAEKLAEYMADPAIASPCGCGNLLVNGDFTLPPPDDATRKLFGFDSDRAESSNIGYGYSGDDVSSGQPRPTIEGRINLSRGVDLSIERFIVLAVDDRTPIRIDCSGKEPARTQLSEIITAINTAMGAEIAFEVLEGEQPTGRLAVRSTRPNTEPLITSVELYLWCSTRVPSQWQGTAGSVHRFKLPNETNQIAVLLADLNWLNAEEITLFCASPTSSVRRTSAPAEISLAQRVPGTANCTYRLQFTFGIVDNSLSPPRWQVVWLNSQGEVLRTDEENIQMPTQLREQQIPPWLFEARVTAPVDATQAEIRFVQPSPGGLWLTGTAFSPTLETLDDINLALHDRGSSRWQRLSAWIDPAEVGIILRGNGAEDVILTQIVDVIAGESYNLQVQARSEVPSTGVPETNPIQHRARLELRWLDGVPGMPVILPLDGRAFPLQTWTGIAPPEATQAEIRLIQPQGEGNLIVESVSLSPIDSVPVPLIFLCETPGELTVSNWHVTYDLPEPPTALSRLSSSSTQPRQSPSRFSQQPVTAVSVRSEIVPPPHLMVVPSSSLSSSIRETQPEAKTHIHQPSTTPIAKTIDLKARRYSQVELSNEFIFSEERRQVQHVGKRRASRRIVKRARHTLSRLSRVFFSKAKLWMMTRICRLRRCDRKRTKNNAGRIFGRFLNL